MQNTYKALGEIGRALQVTTVDSKDGRALPGVTISIKSAGPGSKPTALRPLSKTDTVHGRPYSPARDGW